MHTFSLEATERIKISLWFSKIYGGSHRPPQGQICPSASLGNMWPSYSLLDLWVGATNHEA